MVGCEHRSAPAFGQPSDRHLERRVAAQCIAVITVGITRRDQQGAVADHLGKLVPHPVRLARVFEAASQPLGDPKPLLDGGQQQDAGIGGEPPAVESNMHGFALHRWQTRQNPRTFRHGGRELRCLRMIRIQQPNHTRNQRFIPLPPPSSRDLVNFAG